MRPERVEVVPDFVVNTSCLRAAWAITAGNLVDELSTAAAISASLTASNAIPCVIRSRDSSSEMSFILWLFRAVQMVCLFFGTASRIGRMVSPVLLANNIDAEEQLAQLTTNIRKLLKTIWKTFRRMISSPVNLQPRHPALQRTRNG